MNAFLYLYKTTIKNRIKKSLKRPVTYLYLLLIIGYFVMIFGTLGGMITTFSINTPQGMAAVFTVFAFFIIPVNLISYCKRKGLVFTKSDVHLLFPAPVHPKAVLLYAHIKQVILSFVIGIFLVIAGCLWFDVSLWRMLLYFVFAMIIENILEGSIMMILYGSEKIKPVVLQVIRIAMYIFILSFFAIGLAVFVEDGFTQQAVLNYLHSDAIQLVPLMGWNIAVIHLLIVAPTTINIICTILYFISAIILFVFAYRMKCTGEYYEDAIKFAEDYAVAREKGKRGQVAFIGKKEKFQKASVVYKGHFGKALFYRQLLEYKKNKLFIFGLNTLICVAAVVLVFFMGKDGEIAASQYRPYIMPGILAYVCFIFAGYPTKWNKEMASPYTYMIPDTPFRKLWYATVIEHVRSFIDGALFAIPAAIILKAGVGATILTILIYVCLQASKLYATVMMEALLGNILGAAAKQIFRMLMMSLLIGFGVVAAVLGNVFISLEAGFIFMILITVVLTAVFMLIASSAFDKMEAID